MYAHCADSLERARTVSLSRQPCIRDIWHDHALFTGQSLTAIVDFGAMRIDSVTVDITRLLGSLVEDDPTGWRIGLAAYEKIRPLTDDETSLLATIDLANTILSATNWIRWIFIDQRQFEEISRIQARMERIISRLRFRFGQSFK